jgi:hypothetical protein
MAGTLDAHTGHPEYPGSFLWRPARNVSAYRMSRPCRGQHGRRDVGHGIFAQRSTLGPSCCWRKVALNTTSRPEPWDEGRRSCRSWRWARVGRRHHARSLRRQSAMVCHADSDGRIIRSTCHAFPNMPETATQPDKQADTASGRLLGQRRRRVAARRAVGGGYCWVGGTPPRSDPATRKEIHGRARLGGLGIARECWTLERLA